MRVREAGSVELAPKVRAVVVEPIARVLLAEGMCPYALELGNSLLHFCFDKRTRLVLRLVGHAR